MPDAQFAREADRTDVFKRRWAEARQAHILMCCTGVKFFEELVAAEREDRRPQPRSNDIIFAGSVDQAKILIESTTLVLEDYAEALVLAQRFLGYDRLLHSEARQHIQHLCSLDDARVDLGANLEAAQGKFDQLLAGKFDVSTGHVWLVRTLGPPQSKHDFEWEVGMGLAAVVLPDAMTAEFLAMAAQREKELEAEGSDSGPAPLQPTTP